MVVLCLLHQPEQIKFFFLSETFSIIRTKNITASLRAFIMANSLLPNWDVIYTSFCNGHLVTSRSNSPSLELCLIQAYLLFIDFHMVFFLILLLISDN
jgi:hypothetical protein